MNSCTLITIIVLTLSIFAGAQNIVEQNPPICDPLEIRPSVNVITDTNGVDLGPYLEIAKRQVKQRWYSLIPASASFKRACVSIQFKILQNGDIADAHYVSTSGDVGLDRAALGGIVSVDSLPPLPAGFKGDHLGLRFNFFYNLRPEGAPHNPRSETPAIDEAALAPSSPVHGSTQDFARIADSVNLAYVNAISTTAETPSPNPSTDIQIVPGRLVHKVDPKYPKEAHKNKTQGSVVLEATIEKNGSVTNLSIISGDLILADAAVDAVQGWKFEPYTASGNPIQVRQKLTFNFASGDKTGELNLQLAPPTLADRSLIPVRREASPGDTFYAVGHGVTAPRAIYAPDPPYNEAARKGKYQGTCLLSLIVGSDGQPHDIQVVRALGMCLDERAVSTVEQWKFQPGTKDGNPVAVYVVIEVTFHLY